MYVSVIRHYSLYVNFMQLSVVVVVEERTTFLIIIKSLINLINSFSRSLLLVLSCLVLSPPLTDRQDRPHITRPKALTYIIYIHVNHFVSYIIYVTGACRHEALGFRRSTLTQRQASVEWYFFRIGRPTRGTVVLFHSVTDLKVAQHHDANVLRRKEKNGG